MMSVEEALARILAEITPMAEAQVLLSETLGLALAQDIVAQEDMPPFANSAMDGYALLSRDSQPHGGQPPRLKVTGGVAAALRLEFVINSVFVRSERFSGQQRHQHDDQ